MLEKFENRRQPESEGSNLTRIKELVMPRDGQNLKTIVEEKLFENKSGSDLTQAIEKKGFNAEGLSDLGERIVEEIQNLKTDFNENRPWIDVNLDNFRLQSALVKAGHNQELQTYDYLLIGTSHELARLMRKVIGAVLNDNEDVLLKPNYHPSEVELQDFLVNLHDDKEDFVESWEDMINGLDDQTKKMQLEFASEILREEASRV